MKEFYLDVTVIEKRRIRVAFEAKKKPTKDKMLEILKNEEYQDITDEETYDYLSVEEVGDEQADS